MNRSTNAAAAAALAVGALALTGCASTPPLPNAAISGKFVRSAAMNPGSVGFTATVTNGGPDASGWSCSVKFHDPARAYSGFDTFTSTNELAAGSDVKFTGQVVVTGDGAAYATEREIECEPETQK